MKTITYDFGDYQFQTQYNYKKWDAGDYLNAPEGPEIEIGTTVLLDDDFVTGLEEDINAFDIEIPFPDHEFITDQIIEFETNI